MSEIQSVSYRCSECRENFGDPEREPQFETWNMIVLLHIYNDHEKSPELINEMLVAMYSEAKW